MIDHAIGNHLLTKRATSHRWVKIPDELGWTNDCKCTSQLMRVSSMIRCPPAGPKAVRELRRASLPRASRRRRATELNTLGTPMKYRGEQECRLEKLGDGVSPSCDEFLLFRQKDPKPCWPWHGLWGALRGSPAPAAGKLAALTHCPPSLRCRLHGSAMPPGQRTQEGKGESTCRAHTRSAG